MGGRINTLRGNEIHDRARTKGEGNVERREEGKDFALDSMEGVAEAIVESLRNRKRWARSGCVQSCMGIVWET